MPTSVVATPCGCTLCKESCIAETTLSSEWMKATLSRAFGLASNLPHVSCLDTDLEHNHLTIKTFMAIMAERDAAIRERNMALEERKRAFAERDMAMLQREAALAERNSAIQERDEAIAIIRFRGNSMNDDSMASDLPENRIEYGAKRNRNDQQMHQMFDPVEAKYSRNDQQMHQMFDLADEAKYSRREIPTSDALQTTGLPSETAKPRKIKKIKETTKSKSPKVSKKGGEGLSRQLPPTHSSSWKSEQDLGDDEENLDRHLVAWKDNLGLNQVNFDESAMPVPVCSCTGVPQPCYKWGNGGWQSACCTTTMSMYPLPLVSSKRYSRVGGRKMSGSVFSKLLNRLADEGHDLSMPLDLKDHWAKHGSNRYSTLK
ncbi:hypothetical protein RJ640_016298 [Escallonia rubra]|uniref:GAGA-binding transcriptional activator n=1 Tax=Escallonia rubra TaxID=112253 RepID=A0AA88R4C3_9ASTE|nr:hypothetical protein RJ640_016298 [Escallonia rubra]